jgi:hypothetical protein
VWLLEILPHLQTNPPRHRHKTFPSFSFPSLSCHLLFLPQARGLGSPMHRGWGSPARERGSLSSPSRSACTPRSGLVASWSSSGLAHLGAMAGARRSGRDGRSSPAKARRLPSPTLILPANQPSFSSRQGEIRPRLFVKSTSCTPLPPNSRRSSLRHAPLYLYGHSIPDAITPLTWNRGEAGLPPTGSKERKGCTQGLGEGGMDVAVPVSAFAVGGVGGHTVCHGERMRAIGEG